MAAQVVEIADTVRGLLPGISHGVVSPAAAVSLAATSPLLMGELMLAIS